MTRRPRLSPESALIVAVILCAAFWWTVIRAVHGLLTGAP